jgi:hypothetical protein
MSYLEKNSILTTKKISAKYRDTFRKSFDTSNHVEIRLVREARS